MTSRRRTAVLISGRGSNMQALVSAAQAPDYPAEISLVLSNRPDAAGLEFARANGVAAAAIDHKAFPDRVSFDDEVDRVLRAHDIELIACAGFMRIFSTQFVERWLGRIINVHPALLPAYPGLETHERALADGVSEHGCTVHFVIPKLDAGPTIAQACVPVLEGDTADTLAARVLIAEHDLYPRALADVASGAARLDQADGLSAC